MATNPILDEINGLSPAAKSALQMAGHVLAPPAAPGRLITPAPQPAEPMRPAGGAAPSTGLNLSQQNKLNHADVAGPEPTIKPMAMPDEENIPNLVDVPRGTVVAPRGTFDGDMQARDRLMNSPDGISQIAHKIEHSSFGEAHPTLGRLLGYGAEVPAMIGDVALSNLAPNIAAQIPGTALHHQRLLANADRDVGADLTIAKNKADTAETTARTQHDEDEGDLEKQQAAALAAKQAGGELVFDKDGNAIGFHDGQGKYMGANDPNLPAGVKDVLGAAKPKFGPETPLGANLDPINRTLVDRYQVLHPGQQPPTEFQLPANATQADYERVEKSLAAMEQAEGTVESRKQTEELRRQTMALAAQNSGEKNLWSVPQPDGSLKVVSLKAGDTIPKGAVSLSGQSSANGKEESADAPTVAALKFANNYMAGGKFTGPSDEALQDQFFQMAKPSTGFRMNQAQIDQLHDMTSWIQGNEGQAYHAEYGTWFAPEQRQQIVQTMNDLAASKGIVIPSDTPSDPDVVYDDKGTAHKYKGSGDRSDPANYDVVKK